MKRKSDHSSNKTDAKRKIFRSMGAKIVLTCIAVFILLLGIIYSIFTISNYRMVTNLLGDKLTSDVCYLIETLRSKPEDAWYAEDGKLYIGSNMVGDGTMENANTSTFEKLQNATGTLSGAYVRVADDAVDQTVEYSYGSETGHYKLVSGCLDDDNAFLFRPYLSKTIAGRMDKGLSNTGLSQTNGQYYYCIYMPLTDDDGETVGVLVLCRATAAYYNSAVTSTFGVMLLVGVVLLLAIGIIIFVSSRFTSKVGKLEKYINSVSEEELPEEPLRISNSDELSAVVDSLNQMVVSLKEKKRLGTELAVANSIQAEMLPTLFPIRKDFEIYATMDPAKEVGGDFYDFFLLDRNHLGVVIADVSGKGIPAALFMVKAKTMIKDNAMLGLETGEILTKTNKLLCEGNDENLFITCWIAIIDLNSGFVQYANAGHNPPLLRRGDHFAEMKCAPGFVLAGMPGIHYRTYTMQLNPDDILFLYTDGITESTNTQNQLYGIERLLAEADEHQSDSMEELCGAIKKDADDFSGAAPQFDDITMLAVHFLGGGGEIFQMEMEAVLENVPVITDAVDEQLEAFACNRRAQVQIDVAIDEIFSNIAYYAYPKGTTGKVKITLDHLVERNQIALEFADWGTPFNPLERAEPDTTLTAEQRKIGGLGIHIVKKTMDEVRYEYKNGQNVLTLIRKIH